MVEKVELIKIIDNYFDIQITEEDFDKNMFTEVGLDSLDLMELIMELEEVLHINIPDSVCDTANTLNDLIRNIEEL